MHVQSPAHTNTRCTCNLRTHAANLQRTTQLIFHGGQPSSCVLAACVKALLHCTLCRLVCSCRLGKLPPQGLAGRARFVTLHLGGGSLALGGHDGIVLLCLLLGRRMQAVLRMLQLLLCTHTTGVCVVMPRCMLGLSKKEHLEGAD